MNTTQQTRTAFLRPLAIVISIAFLNGGAFAAEPPKTPPDLTLDQSVDRKLTYNLGPTGLRGWIYTRPANFRESQQGRTTTLSRQILVTHVGVKSPADGVMKVDDVILGVGENFSPTTRAGRWVRRLLRRRRQRTMAS